ISPRPLGSISVNVQLLSVGRPSLDLGTLGLKEGCEWLEWSGEVGIIRYSKKIRPVASDLSGGVAMVRGKLRGILVRAKYWGALLVRKCFTTSRSPESQSFTTRLPMGTWPSEGLVSIVLGAIQILTTWTAT
ncbi:MAG: hypothetical protein ACYC19_08880, partial [Acidimicrobiales bacterium]